MTAGYYFQNEKETLKLGNVPRRVTHNNLPQCAPPWCAPAARPSRGTTHCTARTGSSFRWCWCAAAGAGRDSPSGWTPSSSARTWNVFLQRSTMFGISAFKKKEATTHHFCGSSPRAGAAWCWTKRRPRTSRRSPPRPGGPSSGRASPDTSGCWRRSRTSGSCTCTFLERDSR